MYVEIITLLLLIMTTIGFFRYFWWFTIFDFPRLHYSLIALILLSLSIFEKNLVLIFINFALLGINVYRIRSFLWPFVSKRKTKSQKRQIMSINAYKNNLNLEKLREVIEKIDPEILLIMEMTNNTQTAISNTLKNYSDILKTPVRDGFEICLLSKKPFINSDISWHSTGKTPLLTATVKINSQKYQIFCAHPKPALNNSWYKQRQEYFSEIQNIISTSDLPVLVLGDFNSVPWEKKFQKFLENTNLKTTLSGYGYKITWPVFFPVFGIPMDHILITQGQQYFDLKVGPYSGSDHFPISINLD